MAQVNEFFFWERGVAPMGTFITNAWLLLMCGISIIGVLGNELRKISCYGVKSKPLQGNREAGMSIREIDAQGSNA
jgi:hypothetical protein